MKTMLIFALLVFTNHSFSGQEVGNSDNRHLSSTQPELTSDPVVVNIISEPSKAKIFIDGKFEGITNKGIFLAPGKYLCRLELEEYLALEDTIIVTSDQQKNTFKYTLTKNKGSIDLKVTPEEAIVKLNGQILSKPYFYEIKPGDYLLNIQADLYDSYNENIKLLVGQVTTRKIELTKNSGNLVLSVQPIGATVKINGKVIENYTNLTMSPAKYEFEVSYPDYSTQKWVTEIVRGQTETIKVVLTEKTGNLQFSISPMESNVSLRRGNQEISKWSGSNLLTKLRIGEYTISAKSPGYKSLFQVINITEGETKILDIEMIPGSAGPPLIPITGGQFTMGCTSEQSDCDYDEYPLRTINLSNYYLSQTELTVNYFRDFVEATGYKTIAEKEGVGLVYRNGTWTKQNGVNWRHDASGNLLIDLESEFPVIHVSWYDAIEYCNWLSMQDGLQPVYTINNKIKDKNNKSDLDQYKWVVKQDPSANGYRLPTEAEWEYAARGGVNKDPFLYSGANILTQVGWAVSNSENSLHAVKEKKPNSLNLYDMSGNLWEWCWDWYENNLSSASKDPWGPNSGEARVLRGGAWDNDESFCRVSGRIGEVPAMKYPIVGFRIATYGKPGFTSGSQNESSEFASESKGNISSKKSRKIDEIALTNAMILEMYEIVKDAQKYYAGSKNTGGGGNSFVGYSLSSAIQKSTIGNYSLQVFADMIILNGNSLEEDDSGKPFAEVILMFTKDEIKSKQIL